MLDLPIFWRNVWLGFCITFFVVALSRRFCPLRRSQFGAQQTGRRQAKGIVDCFGRPMNGTAGCCGLLAMGGIDSRTMAIRGVRSERLEPGDAAGWEPDLSDVTVLIPARNEAECHSSVR